MESSYHMKLVIHNDALVPGFAALLILRELGAVVSALLLTSRVGAGLAAEVGSMQITEQVDALRLLGIDPYRFLVAPRLIACVLGGFVLSVIANIVCLYCAMVVTEVKLGILRGHLSRGHENFCFFQGSRVRLGEGSLLRSCHSLGELFFRFSLPEWRRGSRTGHDQ